MQSKMLSLLWLAEAITMTNTTNYGKAVADGVILARKLERGEITQEEAVRKVLKRAKAEFTITTRVKEKIWGRDDTYLVVEVQVCELNGFKEGDEVKVTVEKK